MKYSGINFYPQSGMCFNISYINYDNFYKAEFDFISSNSNNQKIIIESGKIRDKNRNFIYFVNTQNRLFNLSGNFSENNFNLFLDNKIIYSSNDNYGFCSGINLAWDGSVNFENNLDIQINGDRPSFYFDYKRVDYYLNPLILKISGDSNNLFPLTIYKTYINPLSFATNYFYFSGDDFYNNNYSIEPGNYKELTLIQRDAYSSYFLPLIIETNFGKISQTLPFIRFTNPPESQEFRIQSSVAPGSEFTLNTSDNYSNWNFILDINNSQFNNSGFYITISGLENNSILANGYQDSFTGSWLAAPNRDNTIVSFAFDVPVSETLISDNTNNKQIIYGNVSSGLSMENFSYGRLFVTSGLPEYHKKYWAITGVTVNLFKSGVPTGINNKNIIPIGSGLSGSVFPSNVLLFNIGTNGWNNAGGPTRNNPSGLLNLTIYEGNNFTGSLNNFNKIYESGYLFKNLTGSYLTGDYYTFNTSNLEFNYTKEYIVLFSGNAYGYFSGTLTGITGDGLTGQIPLYFKDNLYLNKGLDNYNENNNIVSSGIFGNFDDEINYTIDKNISLNIGCIETYDKNQITGYLKTFPFLNYQSHNIMVQKQIEFNNVSDFLGKAMYIMSGKNNSFYSGLLFTDENIYKELRANFTITEK